MDSYTKKLVLILFIAQICMYLCDWILDNGLFYHWVHHQKVKTTVLYVCIRVCVVFLHKRQNRTSSYVDSY